MDEEYHLTRTELVLIGLVISIFAYGATLAYGETFEYSGSIPVPDNLIKTDVSKRITHMDDKMFEFTVIYRFQAEDVKTWYEEKLQEYALIPSPAEKVIEEIPKIVLPMVNPILKPYIEDIKRFEKDSPTTSEELEYYELLQELASCQRGTGAAKGIQQEGRFATSTAELDEELKSVDLRGNYGKIKKAIQECKAQKLVLEPITLGVEALNKGIFRDTIQPHHSEFAIVDEYWGDKVPNHEPFELNPHDFQSEGMRGVQAMCDDLQMSDKSKKLLGCDMPLRVGLGLDGTCRDKTEMTEDGKWCVPIDYGFATGPVRTHVGGPLYELSQYKNDDGVAQEHKIVKSLERDFEERHQ